MNYGYFIGLALAPLFALVLISLFAAPVRRLIELRMRECWLKRVLLIEWKV